MIITITIEEQIFFPIITITCSTKLNSTLSLSSPLCLTFMLITTISGQARIKRPTRFPEKARRSRGDGGKSSQLFYSSPMTPSLPHTLPSYSPSHHCNQSILLPPLRCKPCASKTTNSRQSCLSFAGRWRKRWREATG